MEQHDPAYQVESQEHGDGEDDVHVSIGHRRRVGEGQPRCPGEDVLARDGMDGTHQQLQHDEEDPLIRHGYPPIVRTIVDHKQLKRNRRTSRTCFRIFFILTFFGVFQHFLHFFILFNDPQFQSVSQHKLKLRVELTDFIGNSREELKKSGRITVK